jgi:hypothetical protein
MKMKRISVVIAAFLFLPWIGCSYVMDSVEGAITKRSSFSVDVTKSGTSFTLDWSKDAPSIDSDAFAGYEIYITNQPNNEFAGYDILLSGYSSCPGVTGLYDSSLQNSSTKKVTFVYNPSTLSGDTYFFRVGVIYWSEEKEEDRVKDWGSGWSHSQRYLSDSQINAISGGTKVSF